jgi:hypothetical protein
MADEIERRCVEVELRTDGAETRRLEGYPVIYGSPSKDLGGFREIVEPGAFGEALGQLPDVRALFNHDPNQVLGRTRNGTLQLAEDSRGLRMAVTLPDTSYARDVYALVERGDVSQMSFAFKVRRGGETWGTEDGHRVRRLRSLDLLDVSVVTFPAYAATMVAARALEMARETNGQEAEAINGNEAGESRAAALLLSEIEILRRR